MCIFNYMHGLVSRRAQSSTISSQALGLPLRDHLMAVWRADTIVCRFDSTGARTWSQRWGGSDDEQAESVAIDGSGYIYVTGRFSSGSFSLLSTTTLTNKESDGGKYDIYVARFSYGSSLSLNWVKTFGGADDDLAGALVTDGTGVYVCGSFDSTSMAIVTGKTLTNSDSSSGSSTDAWVARLGASDGTVSHGP